MFKLDANKLYMMPAHFGPWIQRSSWYHDVTSIVVTYLTDRDKVRQYLPAPFELDEEPIVSVTASMNRNIDWMAGWGYNLITVGVSAVFKGEDPAIHAPYCLVMWENSTDPIINGRELLGVPKIYADIPDHQEIHGAWYTRASHYGNKIMDMSVGELVELPAKNLKQMNRESKRSALFCWQYIPKIGQLGAAVNAPALFPKESIIKQAWTGKGGIQWRHLTWEQNPTQFHIVNALADLPVLEMRMALVTKGSNNLKVPGHPPRYLIA